MAHAGALRQITGDDLTAEFLQNDWREAKLTKAEFAMLEYAEKLTVAPAMMEQKDIQALRDVGWTDRDILDIAHVCAYFNFRLRMVDGLGLDIGEATVLRARAGSERAEKLAEERGVAMPEDVWGLRAGNPAEIATGTRQT